MLAGGAALLALTGAGRSPTSVQEVWQADVRVQSLEVVPSVRTGAARTRGETGSLSARVVITSDNDDDARGARLEILLPIGVGILRLAPGCHASPSVVAGLSARVTCDLGDIPVRGLREVTVTTTAGPAGGMARFAAFVTSDTPDPQPDNNYRAGTAP